MHIGQRHSSSTCVCVGGHHWIDRRCCLRQSEEGPGLLDRRISSSYRTRSVQPADGLRIRSETSFSGMQFEKDVAPCNALVYLDVPEEVMAKRLVKRGETSGRSDDTEQVIKKRLQTFHDETTPILGFYGKQGKLITIEANREIEAVSKDLSEAFEGLMAQQQVGEFFSCLLRSNEQTLSEDVSSFR